MHPAALAPDLLLRACEVVRSRGSGPGGQHRNKVETHITLTHTPTGTTAAAGERRSQEANRRVAVHRLRVTLAVEVRGESCPKEMSDLWRSRRKGRRLAVNPAHDDYPALLAEAMDAIAAHDWDVAAAAEALGVSTSQLVKLLAHELRALDLVNQARAKRGVGRLR